MRNVIVSIAVVALLAGCATGGVDSRYTVSGSSTVYSLEIDAPRSNGRLYNLYDSGGAFAALTTSNNGKIRFRLPPGDFLRDCAVVTDAKGVPLFGSGADAIYLGPRSEHQAAWRQREAILAEADDSSSVDRAAQGELDSLQSQLYANRAHVGGSCARPQPRALPPQPVVRCGSRNECQQEGAAICFTRYLGAKGCGAALNRYKVPGLLSSPGCAAAAAELAGDKYGFDDAFVDALHGIAADLSTELMKSDSTADQIAGFIIGGVSEAVQLNQAVECTDRFVAREFGAQEAWAAQIAQIRAEPGDALARCQRDIARLAAVREQVASAGERADQTSTRIGAIEQRIAVLERERRPIEWCGSQAIRR